MNLLDQLGAHPNGDLVEFGVLFPGVHPARGHRVEVRIAHEDGRFTEPATAFAQPLDHSVDPKYGDYWSTTIDLAEPGRGKPWGGGGRYLYRYAVTTPGGRVIDWIIDPFAREVRADCHAAFTPGNPAHAWGDEESAWQPPPADDLACYGMNLAKSGHSLADAADKLGHLPDLGLNCVSVMPAAGIWDSGETDCLPLGYLGIDERFGASSDFRKFVHRAHQLGIAVLVDAIYGHASSLFAYEYLYERLGLPSPIMSTRPKCRFEPQVDWHQPFTRDFFCAVNRHWLETYHVDGFRYDCAPTSWEPRADVRGYLAIARATYQLVKSEAASGNPDYARFGNGRGPIRLIQCVRPEQRIFWTGAAVA